MLGAGIVVSMSYNNYLEVIQDENPLRESYEWGFKTEPNKHGIILDKLILSYKGVEITRCNILNVGSLDAWRFVVEMFFKSELKDAYQRQDILGSPVADTRPKPKPTKKKWWIF